MVVNYRPAPTGPLLLFMISVLAMFVAVPLWEMSRYSLPTAAFYPLGTSLLLAPVAAIIWVALGIRAMRRNAQIRREPRALQWGPGGLTLWRGGREQTYAWRQVGPILVRYGSAPRARGQCWLEVPTLEQNGAWTKWTFSPNRLQLTDRSISGIASILEQARTGKSTFGASAPVDPREVTTPARERMRSRVRSTVVVFYCVYCVTLLGMALYLQSSNTTTLTPADPRPWIVAKLTFFAIGSLVLLWAVSATWKVQTGSSSAARALPGLLIVAAFLASIAAVWAYVATEVIITGTTFSGPVERGTALLQVKRDRFHRRQPSVRGHLFDRAGPDVNFTIDAADEAMIEAGDNAGTAKQAWCLAVPVEIARGTIRAKAHEETLLPPGSIRPCS